MLSNLLSTVLYETSDLTHWWMDKMAFILQTIFSNAICQKNNHILTKTSLKFNLKGPINVRGDIQILLKKTFEHYYYYHYHYHLPLPLLLLLLLFFFLFFFGGGGGGIPHFKESSLVYVIACNIDSCNGLLPDGTNVDLSSVKSSEIKPWPTKISYKITYLKFSPNILMAGELTTFCEMLRIPQAPQK